MFFPSNSTWYQSGINLDSKIPQQHKKVADNKELQPIFRKIHIASIHSYQFLPATRNQKSQSIPVTKKSTCLNPTTLNLQP
jgi:hypothetical protein